MTFGVLFSNADNHSQMQMWRGINEFAIRNGIHLIAYMGTYQSSHEDLALHLNTCFDAICNSKDLDGVILFSGYISHMAGGEEIYNDYVSKIPPHIPCVSLSQVLNGIPSILADNEGGIYAAVDHLIKIHGKKQIAFIRGPEFHQEAEERLNGYKKALADNNIPFDERYVLPGDFSHEGARRATLELLDNRKLPFDALAVSDDISALQAITELKNRGIQVPADVAVTGFDDNRDAATFVPSLSTSGQNFYAMGVASAKALFTLVDGGKPEDVEYVHSRFIARQSCGCFRRDFGDETQTTPALPENVDFSEYVMQELLLLFPSAVSLGRWQDWMNTLIEEIKNAPFNKKQFLTRFDEFLVGFSHRSKQYSVWNEVLNVLMMAVQRFDDAIADTPPVMETLLFATALVNDIASNEAIVEENRQSDARLAMRRVTGALVLMFDVDILAEELHRLLPQVGIDMALMGLYANPVNSNDPDANRTIDTMVGFDADAHFYTKNNSWNAIRFSDFSTIDSFEFDRERRSMFFLPLFFKDVELGAVIFPYDAETPVHAYETLRVNLSTAVKGAELIGKIQTLSVTDELTGLLNRRGFFQHVYGRIARVEFSRRHVDIAYAVMFMDMDGLKLINDTYGHKEGDTAIAALATILADALRREDVIGRIGGDEFVVFSAVKQDQGTGQVMARIQEKIDDYNAKKLHPYQVSCSIGSVVLEEVTRECFEEAILSADSVLYEEKMRKKKLGISRR